MERTAFDFHLSAARGWVELGNCAEASKELEKIHASLRTHPDTLEVRCRIYAQSGLWTAAYEMALAISEMAPDRLSGWMFLAESLCRRGKILQAKEVLMQVAGRFPGLAVIPFKLACYSSQLQSDGEAGQWLRRAAECRDFSELANEALEDPRMDHLRSFLQEALRKSADPTMLSARGSFSLLRGSVAAERESDHSERSGASTAGGFRR